MPISPNILEIFMVLIICAGEHYTLDVLLGGNFIRQGVSTLVDGGNPRWQLLVSGQTPA
jgi:hypothetical protein